MNDKPGFTALMVSGQLLHEAGYRFGVWIEDEKSRVGVRAYVVTKENWIKIEGAMQNDVFSFAGMIPLLTHSKDLAITIRESRGILIGELELV